MALCRVTLSGRKWSADVGGRPQNYHPLTACARSTGPAHRQASRCQQGSALRGSFSTHEHDKHDKHGGSRRMVLHWHARRACGTRRAQERVRVSACAGTGMAPAPSSAAMFSWSMSSPKWKSCGLEIACWMRATPALPRAPFARMRYCPLTGASADRPERNADRPAGRRANAAAAPRQQSKHRRTATPRRPAGRAQTGGRTESPRTRRGGSQRGFSASLTPARARRPRPTLARSRRRRRRAKGAADAAAVQRTARGGSTRSCQRGTELSVSTLSPFCRLSLCLRASWPIFFFAF